MMMLQTKYNEESQPYAIMVTMDVTLNLKPMVETYD